jgi:transcriptional regulator with XRE-family HTH domain
MRALRLRADRRQADVAREAHVSRQLISKVEAGDLDGVSIGRLRRIAASLGADLDLRVRWRGEGLDRLLDAARAGLVEGVVSMLMAAGWETAVEVSFSIRGERGSVDVVALHRRSAAILIVEVKTVVPDAGGMLSTLDRKGRLGPEIAKQLGWPCASVSRLLVIGDSSTTRRRVAALAATFATALPSRNWAVKRWLQTPTESLAGVLFLPFATAGGARRSPTGRTRVRCGAKVAGRPNGHAARPSEETQPEEVG